MALYGINDLRARSTSHGSKRLSEAFLTEQLQKSEQTPLDTKFDIFLSYASADWALLSPIVEDLVSVGYSVYVDRHIDPSLRLEGINKQTAETIKARLNCSRSLLYAVTPQSSDSVWMPWEAGYFDARVGRVAILPILDQPSLSDEFDDHQYLSLYPYVSINWVSDKARQDLFVNERGDFYVIFGAWLRGREPYQREPFP